MGWDRHYRPVISLRPSNGPLGLLAAGLVVVSQVQNCRQLEHYGQRWSPMWNSASNAWRWVAVTLAVSRAAWQAAGRSASNQAPSPQRHDFPELHAAVLSGQALRHWKAFAMRVGVQVWLSRLHQRLCANRCLRMALHPGRVARRSGVGAMPPSALQPKASHGTQRCSPAQKRAPLPDLGCHRPAALHLVSGVEL